MVAPPPVVFLGMTTAAHLVVNGLPRRCVPCRVHCGRRRRAGPFGRTRIGGTWSARFTSARSVATANGSLHGGG